MSGTNISGGQIITTDNGGTPGVPHVLFTQTLDEDGRQILVTDGDLHGASPWHPCSWYSHHR